MRSELYFRLISVAALGFMALACVPSVRPEIAQPAPSTQVEVDSVQEVESINSGAYKPYVRPSETSAPEVISPSSI